MINSYSQVNHFDLIKLFFLNSHGGLYYRPMIGVSFLIDRFLWNLDPTIMHLENILFHLISSLLVFFIACFVISKTSKLPLIAALIFAVHPISTESVNWISGRTDLLAVMFVLTSLYFILHYCRFMQIWWLVSAIVALILGVLTKESAIGFIPAVFFIMTSGKTNVADTTNKQNVFFKPVIFFLLACMISIFIAVLFYNHYLAVIISILYFFSLLWYARDSVNANSLLKYSILFTVFFSSLWFFVSSIRGLTFSSQTSLIKRILGLLFTDINYTLSLFFRGAGFYVKKFIYPFPLSFVIRDVSPYYSLFGIILLFLLFVLIVRKELPDSLVVAGLWMIVPALPLTFEHIAWTPYAERYVYSAIPFWIIAIVVYLSNIGFDRLSVRVYKACLAGFSILIIVFAISSFQRNIIWQTNLALFKDSSEKVIGYKPVHGLYMVALFEKGLYDLALQQYRIAQSLPVVELRYNPSYEFINVRILVAEKHFLQAERELDIINIKAVGKNADVYETYLALAPRMILEVNSNLKEKKRIEDKISISFDRLYELKKDPMVLYRKGQFLLSLNKKLEARELFKLVAKKIPENNIYRGYSEKLARSLSGV